MSKLNPHPPSLLNGPKSQSILLTGATGFLGSHLLEALLKAGNKVVILKRSASDTWRIQHLLSKVKAYDIDCQPLEKAFNEQRIDAIIHTACLYGRQGEPMHQIAETNLLFSLQLLDLAISCNTDTFINTDTLLPPHLNAYSLSKKQFVEWLRYSRSRIQVVNLKFEHIYGPRDDNTKFIPWIIEQFIQNAKSINLTQGEQLRDFIYIDDVVSAFMRVVNGMHQIPGFSEFDVGTGILTPIRTLVETIKKLYESRHGKSHTQLYFGAIPYREGEMMSVELDNTALTSLGWKPNISLTSGLTRLISQSNCLSKKC